MHRNLLPVLLLLFSSCSSASVDRTTLINDSEAAGITSQSQGNRLTGTRSKVLGVWADGSTENATFEIRPDSIYYVDNFESYSYIIERDSIKIDYKDYIYQGKIHFVDDTLIMTSEDEMSRFWRFKN
ncbi:hypothetical protein GZH53_15710 [Flavihumibacter sp. R14]|nr:hypothetical protein [Flavihumibacter soli]